MASYPHPALRAPELKLMIRGPNGLLPRREGYNTIDSNGKATVTSA